MSLRVPAPPKGFGAHYLRFIPRNEMDIAVVGVGSSLVLGDDNLHGDGRANRPGRGGADAALVAVEAAAALVGKPISDDTIAAAANAAAGIARPIDDMRGTVQQRIHLTGVLTRRTLQGALSRARGES